jgi:hypothetical protein
VKKFVTVVCACALLVNLNGCGGGSADSIMKDSIQAMNDLSDAIEKKDEAKAKAAISKFEELEKKGKDLKLSDDEKKKLEEKYKGDMEKAMTKFLGAAMKADPDFMKKLDVSKLGGKGKP